MKRSATQTTRSLCEADDAGRVVKVSEDNVLYCLLNKLDDMRLIRILAHAAPVPESLQHAANRILYDLKRRAIEAGSILDLHHVGREALAGRLAIRAH